jgi:uncharacterized membrane protein
MSLAELGIIALLMWIIGLNGRIKSLEEAVASLQDRLVGLMIASEVPEDTAERVVSEEETFQKKPAVPEPHHAHEPERTLSEDIRDDVLVGKATEERVADTEAPAPAYRTEPLPDQPVSTPVPTDKPSWIVGLLVNYFTGGNLLVRIGGVVLFFGLAFLVKYVAEHSTISIGTRLVLVALAAVVLVIVGWILRAREGAYGQILQGLGVAIFYLVLYGASKYYMILPIEVAFGLMFGVAVVGSVLAVIQSSLPLALFAIVGGFLVPILISGGEGSHVVLFGYYLFLNLGIVVMAWYRSWRVLNLVGFLSTFVIATGWGVLQYRSELFATTEPFLILFFLMYVGVSILFVRQSSGHLVDSALVFGLPAATFGLQVSLVETMEYGAAYSATVLGAVYALLAWALASREPYGRLSTSFAWLAVVFFTVAVPYYFDADVTAALWALESTAVVWLALKQSRTYARYAGEALQLVSLGLYLYSMLGYGVSGAEYAGYVIVTGALFATGYLLEQHREVLEYDRYHPQILLGLSVAVWLISGWEASVEIVSFAIYHKMLIVVSMGAVLLIALGRWLAWELPIRLMEGVLGIGMLLFALSVAERGVIVHPLGGLGWLAVPLWMGLSYALMYRYQTQWKTAPIQHIASLWFVALLLTLEAVHWAGVWRWHYVWANVSIALVPFVMLVVLVVRDRYPAWMHPHKSLYRQIGAGGFAGFLTLWQVWTFWMTEQVHAAGYVPILNPLDAAQIAVAGAIAVWLYRYRDAMGSSLRILLLGLAYLFGVTLATVVLARAFHVYGGVAYGIDSLWENVLFQLALASLWAGIIVLSSVYARRLACDVLRVGAGVLSVLMLLWELWAFGYSPDVLRVYFPVFNGLDGVQIGVLGVIAWWAYRFGRGLSDAARSALYLVTVLESAMLISVIFARAIHAYRHVPYAADALWHDLYFQTGLSLLWSATAILLMLLSKRYESRSLWMVGFGLLGVVVLKLFFVELANSGTIERIVSFIVVGVLLLLIGYFVPLPPKAKSDKEENNPKAKAGEETPES